MNKHEAVSTIYGAVLSVSVGTFILQGLGAIVIGILGAFGGWAFSHFIKPRLEKWFKISRRTSGR